MRRLGRPAMRSARIWSYTITIILDLVVEVEGDLARAYEAAPCPRVLAKALRG